MSQVSINPSQVTVGITRTVAQFYGLDYEVVELMSDGYTPYESLVEWDIVDEELIQSLIEEAEKNHMAYLAALAEDVEYEELPF